MQKENNRVVLTGGHAATTAIATIEELIRRSNSGSEIYWIGVENAVEGSRVKTLEAEILPKMGVYFKPISTGRIQRKFTLWTIPSLVKIPIGFISSFILLSKIKPRVILSFGGFAAFPVVVCGWLLGIPVILHEQTACIGRANKFSLPFARKIAISRESTKEFVDGKKCVLTGNPVMTQILDIEPKQKAASKPTVFVSGGSRGSQTINENVKPIIERLTEFVNVIHQTGQIDYDQFKKLERSGYSVFDRIDPMKMDNVYREADIVVSRAGANTVSELIVTGRPSVLIPIPWSYLNEQYENAKFIETNGLGKIIEQKDLTPEKLLNTIKYVSQNWDKFRKQIDSPDRNAASNLVDLLEETVR